MAIGLVMTFRGVTQEHYEAAMGPRGLDLRSPQNPEAGADWPEGIIAHVAGATIAGWCMVEVWESQDHFARFRESRLAPALEQAGIPEPNVIPFEVYNTHI
ncbi:hypothetical protein BH18ACT4_BH18ACT4_03290 [soil metagenome]